MSRKFKPFGTEGKDLVIQFTVKHEQSIDCGGGYVKVFDCSLKPEEMHGDSPYRVMFGPDICGPGTKKVHVILNYKDKNVLINKDIRCKVRNLLNHICKQSAVAKLTYLIKLNFVSGKSE